jgi:hypothetical protein
MLHSMTVLNTPHQKNFSSHRSILTINHKILYLSIYVIFWQFLHKIYQFLSLLQIKSDQQLNFEDSSKASSSFHIKSKINLKLTKKVREALILYHFKYYQHLSRLHLFIHPFFEDDNINTVDPRVTKDLTYEQLGGLRPKF